MKFIIAILYSFVLVNIYAQYDNNRYRTPVFDSLITTTNVVYGSAPQWIFPYLSEDLKLDVYQPKGDTLTKRPLIIMGHAGGFLNGDKGVDDMVAFCDSFAKMGYVTASINYRMGFDPLDGNSATRAVYRGIQDAKAAIRYFKQNASIYHIDTNYVFFGGMSAGGFQALHVAYMDEESERPSSSYGGGTVNDLGCLDCVSTGSSLNVSSKVRAILDYWGAIQDTLLIQSASDAPALIMHGVNDPTVPFNYNHPFGVGTLPSTYGGFPVSIRLQNLGIYHEKYFSHSTLHMLDGSNNGTFPTSGPNAFWFDTLIPRTRDFLYKMIKPNPVKITQDPLVVCQNSKFSINVQPESGFKNIWITPNFITTIDSSSNAFFSSSQSGNYQIGYVEENQILAFSDTLWFSITVNSAPIVTLSVSSDNICKGKSTTIKATGASSYTWNQNLLPGSTQNVSPTTTTTYQAIGYGPNGCTDTVNTTIVVSECLRTENLDPDFIKIFPNPSYNNFVFEGKNLPSHFTHYSILDMSGKILKSEKITADKQIIDTSKLQDGIYFIEFQGQEKLTYRIELIK